MQLVPVQRAAILLGFESATVWYHVRKGRVPIKERTTRGCLVDVADVATMMKEYGYKRSRATVDGQNIVNQKEIQ